MKMSKRERKIYIKGKQEGYDIGYKMGYQSGVAYGCVKGKLDEITRRRKAEEMKN